MKRLALLLPILTGCTWGGTVIELDPETGKVLFERPWLGGPVSFSGSYDKPDGSVLVWDWKSDVDLSHAADVRSKEINALNKALDLAAGSIPAPDTP